MVRVLEEARLKGIALGFGDGMHRFHDHIKLAHYADAAADIEFNFPMGFKELKASTRELVLI